MPERVPSPYELRPYQADAVRAIERDLAADGSALLVLATGLGKTVVGGEVIGNLLVSQPQAKVLVVAHMRETWGRTAREGAVAAHRRPSPPALLTGEDKPRNLEEWSSRPSSPRSPPPETGTGPTSS
ncbi:DEAD/DEAH box helicase family protein [Streptomyces thinghirensis]|nr:DEAD/DEAH box helicase family protein [Streptomyces thinghirensis]